MIYIIYPTQTHIHTHLILHIGREVMDDIVTKLQKHDGMVPIDAFMFDNDNQFVVSEFDRICTSKLKSITSAKKQKVGDQVYRPTW